MDDFYITLPSSVKNPQFRNTSSRYVTRLPQVLRLEKDKYNVAVTDIIYPYSFLNVGRELSYWIHFKDREPVHVTFPAAQYNDVDSIVEALNGGKRRLKRSAPPGEGPDAKKLKTDDPVAFHEQIMGLVSAQELEKKKANAEAVAKHSSITDQTEKAQDAKKKSDDAAVSKHLEIEEAVAKADALKNRSANAAITKHLDLEDATATQDANKRRADKAAVAKHEAIQEAVATTETDKKKADAKAVKKHEDIQQAVSEAESEKKKTDAENVAKHQDITAATTKTATPPVTPTPPPATSTPLPEKPKTGKSAEKPNTPIPTTEKPKTPVPTAEKPKTPIPTIEKPKTPVPTAEKPKTPIPTIEKPKTPVPTAEKPKTPIPTIEKPKTPVPTAEKPKTPIPTIEKPKTPVPTAEKPKTPIPTTEKPKTATSTTETSKTPVPTAETSKTPVPTAEKPKTPIPTAEKPKTPVPTVEKPAERPTPAIRVELTKVEKSEESENKEEDAVAKHESIMNAVAERKKAELEKHTDIMDAVAEEKKASVEKHTDIMDAADNEKIEKHLQIEEAKKEQDLEVEKFKEELGKVLAAGVEYHEITRAVFKKPDDPNEYENLKAGLARIRSMVRVTEKSDASEYLLFKNTNEQIETLFLGNSVLFVEFEPACSYFLGFHDLILRESGIAPSKVDFFGNVSTIYLYCDIVDPIIVGDQKNSLLSVIPCKGKYGEMIHHTIPYPRYLPIMNNTIDSIKVEFLSEFAEPINFHWGSTIIVLHFKKNE